MSVDLDRGILNKFNRGEVAKEAFGREDVSRLQNSCESMVNFLPERLGPMSVRPGTELIDITPGADAILFPLPTSVEDPMGIVMNWNTGIPLIKFMVNDLFLASVVNTSTLANQSFGSAFTGNPLTGWVDADEGAAVSFISAGNLIMTGTGQDAAIVWQTTTTTDTGTRHVLKIVVGLGNVLLQVGTTGFESSNLFRGELSLGIHYIDVTPTAAMSITFTTSNKFDTVIASCELASTAVDYSINTFTALNDFIAETEAGLKLLRYAASGNALYVTSAYGKPFVIRRRGPTSVSLERFMPKYGPYESLNTSSITMNPTAPLDGNMAVVASNPFFGTVPFTNKDWQGVLFKMAVTGQQQTGNFTGLGQTESIFVFGNGAARTFTLWVALNSGSGWAVVLEKSFDDITYQVVETYTTPILKIYSDALENAELFYRLRVTTIGTANLDLTLTYDYGIIEAQGRSTDVAGSSTLNVEWYEPLNVDQTVKDWYIGSWGGRNNWPSAVAVYEGRLWFAGGNKLWGSETDFFESFDRNLPGGSASIQRTIGFGAVEDILWLAPSARLVAGTALNEVDAKSDVFGSVLTDLNTNLKSGSDQGCANVAPITSNQEVIFVQRSGTKLMGIDFNIQSEKHELEDFNMLLPAPFGAPTVDRMDIVKSPETRIYLVMSDGTMRVLLRDKVEDVLAWSRITVQVHNGTSTVDEFVKDVMVLPGQPEDRVYILTASGKLLKFAQNLEAKGENISKHFDSFKEFTSPGTTITLGSAANFVNGRTVQVWADGADRGSFVIATNQIVVPTAWTNVIVGFQYDSTYKSNKLGDYSSGSVLTANKRIINTGLIMRNYAQGSVTIGPDTASLSAMPAIEKGVAAVDEVDYDFLPFEFDGESETDPRVHIKATGPCTILALSYEVKDTDRRTKQKGKSG